MPDARRVWRWCDLRSSFETTHVYVEADLLTKEKALAKLKPSGSPVRRFKPDDALLAFRASL